jgi:hypothetical protein
MTVLTDFRLAVAAVVEETTGIRVKAGKFDGPVKNSDLGCAFPMGKREDSSNVSREIMEVRVRLFKNNQDRAADPEISLLDPAPLEALIEECQQALAPDGTGGANVGIWFARMTEAEVNMEQYGIEFAVIAVAWNQFAVV